MVALSSDDGFVDVTRVETSDVALGGDEINVPNKQFVELASRDQWLRDELERRTGSDATAIQSFERSRDLSQASIAQGRLTLETGDPTPSSDITAATTLHYTPFNGDLVSLWNSAESRWDVHQFPELDLSLSGLAANTNFDIFADIVDGEPALTGDSAVAWANSGAGTSVRASAISQRNGIWVETSSDRRYLGTIRTTGVAGQCEDSQEKRFVFNAQNRIRRRMFKKYTGSHTYTSATLRYLANSSANNISFVCGLESLISATFVLNARGTVSGVIGVNGLTKTSATDGISADASSDNSDTLGIPGFYSNDTVFGYNFWALLEQNKFNDANGFVSGGNAGVFQTGIEGFGDF